MSMTDEQPRVEVTGPITVPYPYGLFSLPFAGTPSEPGWQGTGVWWNTNACQAVGVTRGRCTVDDEVPALDSNVECSWVPSGAAFTVYARSTQSIGGQPIEAKFAQAREVLASGEQLAVEQALWEMMMAATAAGPLSEASGPQAIARAELAIAQVYGGTPVLHMDRRIATMSQFAGGVLHTEGTRLKTFLGSSAVAGGGYAPTGENTPAVIATGAVQLIRSEMFDLGRHIDQATNELSAVVERTYVLGWDCAAVRVNIEEID